MPNEFSEFKDDVRKVGDKLKNLSGVKSGGQAAMVVLALLLLAAGFSSIYTIDPEEAGVILRFGRYLDTTGPGLHFKLPFGIDKLYKVQLTTIRKEEFGFRTSQAGVVTRYENAEYNDESLMLTGDLNVADVEWILQYKVNDPYKFLFHVRNVNKNLRDVSEAIMRLVVGDRSVSDVLTTERVAIADQVKVKMQETFDLYGMGVTVTNVILQDVNPPETVKDSFNEVNAAKQEQEKMVNEAWEAYNQAIPEEKGKADQTIQVAEGYALERINKADGEAKRFRALFRAYVQAPAVTRTRLYLEKMEEVLKRPKQVYIMDPAAKTLLPLLNLKERPAPASAPAAAAGGAQ